MWLTKYPQGSLIQKALQNIGQASATVKGKNICRDIQ